MNEHESQIYTQDPWRIFRILAEFVEGFEVMTSLGPAVAFFGSSTGQSHHSPYYVLAKEISKKIAKRGFGVITGGGFGVMEAVNKGAQEVKGRSCGLCIHLLEKPNDYIDSQFLLHFRYFFVRKVLFVKYAKAFIVLPGGFGTLNELFEALTLIKTEKSKPFPVILAGKKYWEGLFDWMKKTIIRQHNLERDDLDLMTLSDDPEEIAEIVEQHFLKTKIIENF